MKFLPFIWSQLARNKIRTALTAGAIGLAVSLVCLLLTMPAGLDALLSDVASNTRIVVHNEAGLVYPLPYAYLQKIRAQQGVVSAASWTWYGGVFREEKGVEFPNFAVEPDPIGIVWEDWGIDPKQLEEFQRNRDGALVEGLRRAGKRRRDRRPRHAAEERLEDRRPRDTEGHHLPGGPELPDRR